MASTSNPRARFPSYVQPGEPWAPPPAFFHNTLVDVAKGHAQAMPDGGGFGNASFYNGCILDGFNDSGVELNSGDAGFITSIGGVDFGGGGWQDLVVSRPIITVGNQPVGLPQGGTGSEAYAVAVGACDPNTWGQFQISGVARVRVFGDAQYTRAGLITAGTFDAGWVGAAKILWRYSQWALVLINDTSQSLVRFRPEGVWTNNNGWYLPARITDPFFNVWKTGQVIYDPISMFGPAGSTGDGYAFVFNGEAIAIQQECPT